MVAEKFIPRNNMSENKTKNTIYQIYINLEVILYKLVTTIKEQFVNIS